MNPETDLSLTDAVSQVHEMHERGHKSLRGSWKHQRQFRCFYFSKIGAANLLNSMCPLGDCERGRLLSIVTDVSRPEPMSDSHSIMGNSPDFGYSEEFICDVSGFWLPRTRQIRTNEWEYRARLHQVFLALVAKNPSLNTCCITHDRLFYLPSFGPYKSLSVCANRWCYSYGLEDVLEGYSDKTSVDKLSRIFGISASSSETRRKVVPKQSLSDVGARYGESIDQVLSSLDSFLCRLSADVKTKFG